MDASNYESHTTSSPNPLARFSHHARLRFGLSLVDSHSPLNGSVVAFGAGTGLFLNSLPHLRSDLTLYGIEPYMAMRVDCASALASFAPIGEASMDVVTAFEVCEHLDDREFNDFLEQSSRVLRRSGNLIISVPIMIGPIIVLKEMNRMLFVRQFDYSGKELVAASLGRQVARAINIRVSHKGFDYRKLRSVLLQQFTIVEMAFSPLPRLPWWLNSQVFFVCAKAIS